MAGTAVESAKLGWHGLEGDRRLAFRRVDDHSGSPWLTASRLGELIRYHPVGPEGEESEPSPTQVRTPGGTCLELHGPELQAEITRRLGSPVELMKLSRGIFDEAPVSLISLATIEGIAQEAGLALDRRRFRANIFLEPERAEPFQEDGWVGGTLVFGQNEPRPAVQVTRCDSRCMMVNLDPETARQDGRVLKAIVRLNQNNAGVYATVIRTGTIRVGDPVYLAGSATIP